MAWPCWLLRALRLATPSQSRAPTSSSSASPSLETVSPSDSLPFSCFLLTLPLPLLALQTGLASLRRTALPSSPSRFQPSPPCSLARLLTAASSCRVITARGSSPSTSSSALARASGARTASTRSLAVPLSVLSRVPPLTLALAIRRSLEAQLSEGASRPGHDRLKRRTSRNQGKHAGLEPRTFAQRAFAIDRTLLERDRGRRLDRCRDNLDVGAA